MSKGNKYSHRQDVTIANDISIPGLLRPFYLVKPPEATFIKNKVAPRQWDTRKVCEDGGRKGRERSGDHHVNSCSNLVQHSPMGNPGGRSGLNGEAAKRSTLTPSNSDPPKPVEKIYTQSCTGTSVVRIMKAWKLATCLTTGNGLVVNPQNRTLCRR